MNLFLWPPLLTASIFGIM